MSRAARATRVAGEARRSDGARLGARLDRFRSRVWEVTSGVLRLPRTLTVDGVRYRERTREPLRRALSKTGSGVKEYDVRFPGPNAPAPMTIRATRERVYADLAPAPRPRLYALLSRIILPGQRVFELGCGTGAGAAYLAHLAGPSGGVVAVGEDREAIRFARRRYRNGPIGFEHGGHETLAGELEGAYDSVILCDPPESLVGGADTRRETLAELWRVVAPGGVLVLARTDSAENAVSDAVEMSEWVRTALGAGDPEATLMDAGGGVCIVIRKPEAEPGPLARGQD